MEVVQAVELTEADIYNLSLIVTAKSAAGAYQEFERLLTLYGKWGLSGCMPKALECPGSRGQRSFAITDNMMLYIEQCVCAQREKLSERPDLWLAFRLQYLTVQYGEQYEKVRQKYRKALHEQQRVYSVRTRQRDAAAFVKRLHKGIKEMLLKM